MDRNEFEARNVERHQNQALRHAARLLNDPNALDQGSKEELAVLLRNLAAIAGREAQALRAAPAGV